MKLIFMSILIVLFYLVIFDYFYSKINAIEDEKMGEMVLIISIFLFLLVTFLTIFILLHIFL